MDNIRIGFIGAGKHARANLFPSLKLLQQPVTSVCSQQLDRAESAAREFQASRAYSQYSEMLEKEKLDAVIVATGIGHATIVADCLNAGLHVFVEKPLGLNPAEAQSVAAAAQAAGKIVMVGFNKRFAPAYVRLKQVIQEDETFGEVLSLQGMFAIGPRERGDENYLKNTGIHYVDLVRFLSGEVDQVFALSNTREELIDQAMLLSFHNGRIGTLFFGGLPAWRRHYEEITVTGVNGFARVENIEKLVVHTSQPLPYSEPQWQNVSEEDRVYTPTHTSSSGGWQDLYLNGYVAEMATFLECVRNQTQPGCNAADNVKTMKLCETILDRIRLQ
jgi:UDP-N-acetylglucosamine 3-dehydrogenase